MIELKNITYTYENQLVFENLSLTVERGQKVGIVGESGCGKSTLLKILAGLYQPSSGTVKVDGETQPAKITQKVSIVMQSPMLLPLTILENITMGHDYPKERVERAVDAANLRGWIDTLPDGLNTYLGDRADELSGDDDVLPHPVTSDPVSIATINKSIIFLFILSSPLKYVRLYRMPLYLVLR